MTKPLQLIDFNRTGVDVAYFGNACQGTLRGCPLKSSDADMMLLALQISGFEYVDPLAVDTPHYIVQMLHNGTADLDLVTGEIAYPGYKLAAYTGAVGKHCYYFLIYTEFLLNTIPWVYYVYLALGIVAISTILTISQRESVRSMLVEWPHRLLAVVLRQPTLDRFSRNARLSGLAAAAASFLPFTILAIYFELNIRLLLAVPFQRRLPAQNIDELIHAMKHGGYKFITVEGGYSPMEFATPKQTTELKALADRFVVYPDDGYDDVFRSISNPALKQVSIGEMSWSVNYCADLLITDVGPPYLLVKIKGIAPRYIAYVMRRELYKERERLNRALALVQPAASNVPLPYFGDSGAPFEYSLKLNLKYNIAVRFAQYRLVWIFFGVIYLGCVLVFLLEIVVHNMAHWLRMWYTLGTARLFH